MDIMDRAADREQMDRDLAIAAAHHHAPDIPAIGICYNCEASLPEGVRFCDCDCRNDYEKRKDAERRQ